MSTHSTGCTLNQGDGCETLTHIIHGMHRVNEPLTTNQNQHIHLHVYVSGGWYSNKNPS